MVQIAYIGHSCFRITDASGKVIVTDPFHSVNVQKPQFNINYPEVSGEADVVLVSHPHNDHSAVELFSNTPYVVNCSREFQYGGFLSGTAIPAWHDDCQGKEKGENLIMVWSLGGIRFCHLGDLGQHSLTQEQINGIGRPDVLFVPVGGGFTIGPETAVEIVAALVPRLVLPMHFKAEQVPFLPYGLDVFLSQMPQIWTRLPAVKGGFVLDQAGLGNEEGIQVMEIHPL